METPTDILEADVSQSDDFKDEFDQIINQLIDEDSGRPFEMNLPKLGISILADKEEESSVATSTVSTTLADISSYPQFGFNISVSEVTGLTGGLLCENVVISLCEQLLTKHTSKTQMPSLTKPYARPHCSDSRE